MKRRFQAQWFIGVKYRIKCSVRFRILCEVSRGSYYMLLHLGSDEPSSSSATNSLQQLLLSEQTPVTSCPAGEAGVCRCMDDNLPLDTPSSMVEGSTASVPSPVETTGLWNYILKLVVSANMLMPVPKVEQVVGIGEQTSGPLNKWLEIHFQPDWPDAVKTRWSFHFLSLRD